MRFIGPLIAAPLVILGWATVARMILAMFVPGWDL